MNVAYNEIALDRGNGIIIAMGENLCDRIISKILIERLFIEKETTEIRQAYFAYVTKYGSELEGHPVFLATITEANVLSTLIANK